MLEEKKEKGFDHVMAASIQDMKNSLNILQHTLEKMPSSRFKDRSLQQEDEIALHYEVARIQNNVAQLHSLFLLENDLLPLQLKEVYLIELIEEKLISHQRLFDCLDLKVDIVVDPSLSVYTDELLFSQVMDIAIVNAARYSASSIRITATHNDNGVFIVIEDDGNGYPEAALKDFTRVVKDKTLSNLTNQTLAWYFCYSVAKMHRVKRRHGWVKLSNKGELGGSSFEVFIP